MHRRKQTGCYSHNLDRQWDRSHCNCLRTYRRKLRDTPTRRRQRSSQPNLHLEFWIRGTQMAWEIISHRTSLQIQAVPSTKFSIKEVTLFMLTVDNDMVWTKFTIDWTRGTRKISGRGTLGTIRKGKANQTAVIHAQWSVSTEVAPFLTSEGTSVAVRGQNQTFMNDVVRSIANLRYSGVSKLPCETKIDNWPATPIAVESWAIASWIAKFDTASSIVSRRRITISSCGSAREYAWESC